MKSIILNNNFFVKWNSFNLLPIVIQEVLSNNLLMLAWFNKESLFKSFINFNIYYYSRSRNKLWFKGLFSKNIQYIKFIYLDCDMDVILIKIIQLYNISCHTGNFSCFYNKLNY